MFTLSYTYTHTHKPCHAARHVCHTCHASCLPKSQSKDQCLNTWRRCFWRRFVGETLWHTHRQTRIQTGTHTLKLPLPTTDTHTHATALQVQSAALPLLVPVRVVQLNAINMSNLIDAINFWAPCRPLVSLSWDTPFLCLRQYTLHIHSRMCLTNIECLRYVPLPFACFQTKMPNLNRHTHTHTRTYRDRYKVGNGRGNV